MEHGCDILIFSDLDGTLLDHRSYCWAAARPALEALRHLQGGLVLASSKTAAELQMMRSAIGFPDWPSIVENGSGLLAADDPAQQGRGEAAMPIYTDLRSRIATLPPGFRGFGDMSVQEVAERTGLAPAEARRARMRQFSEPGLWCGAAADLVRFLDAAHEMGMSAQQGGRFLTLSFGATKADQMDRLIAQYQPRVTLALGDAPNDIAMLERADFGVIVANPAAAPIPALPGEKDGRISRTQKEGPQGWSDAVLGFLRDHSLTEGLPSHG